MVDCPRLATTPRWRRKVWTAASSMMEPAKLPDTHIRACCSDPHCQLRSTADVKLAVDIMQVHFYGAFAHIEFAANFLVVQPSRYEVSNFSLAWRQTARNS